MLENFYTSITKNKQKVATALHRLSKRQFYQIEEGSLKKNFISIIKSVFISEASFIQVAKETENLYKALRVTTKEGTSQIKLEYFQECMKNPESIQRSREGTGGVFFVISKYGRPVIKFERNPEQVIIADALLGKMGFLTPQSFVVSRKDAVGKEAIEKLKTTNIEWRDEKSQRPVFNRQINDRNEKLLCMDLIDAQSLSDLSKPELEEILNNDEFLQNLGKIALLDAFMNNVDRFSTSRFNAENVMITPPLLEEEDGSQNRKVAVIDNFFGIVDKYDVKYCKKNLTSSCREPG